MMTFTVGECVAGKDAEQLSNWAINNPNSRLFVPTIDVMSVIKHLKPPQCRCRKVGRKRGRVEEKGVKAEENPNAGIKREDFRCTEDLCSVRKTGRDGGAQGVWISPSQPLATVCLERRVWAPAEQTPPPQTLPALMCADGVIYHFSHFRFFYLDWPAGKLLALRSVQPTDQQAVKRRRGKRRGGSWAEDSDNDWPPPPPDHFSFNYLHEVVRRPRAKFSCCVKAREDMEAALQLTAAHESGK